MALPTLLRKLHYWGSIIIALPIAVIICTGLLLQLKKQIAMTMKTMPPYDPAIWFTFSAPKRGY